MQHNHRSPHIVAAIGGSEKAYQSNNVNQFTKPLPPFGKEAAFLLSMGAKPRNDIFIFAGLNAWQKAKASENTQIVLCLPPDINPFNYFWPVDDCPTLLFDTGNLTVIDIDKIAFCLLCANAEIVRAVLVNGDLIIYRRDAA